MSHIELIIEKKEIVLEINSRSNPTAGGPVEWNSILNKPDEFPPAAHEHAQSDIAGLEEDLNALNDHAEDTANPHQVTLEQARAQNNQLAGSIDANGAQLNNLINPTQAQQAATKSYADAAEANAKAYADSLVTAVFRPAGDWDASVGSYPTTGTGTSGAVRRGDTYKVSVAGNGYDVGDSIYAIINSPGQSASNWGSFEHNTQQATESLRGTAVISSQAIAENENTTNDTDIITPKKLWQAVAHAWSLTAFLAAVRGTLLAGLSTSTNAVITASDTILSALGKLQKQITDNLGTLTAHTANMSNPHGLTKSQIGLSNVDNTTDLAKPISSLTQTALNLKADASLFVQVADAAFTGTITWTGTTAPSGSADHRISYQQTDKRVWFSITLNYATAGTALTNLTLSSLSQLPTPAAKSGWNVALANNWRLLGSIDTTQTALGAGFTCWLRKNAANNAFEIGGVAVASANYRYVTIVGDYIAA